MVVPDISVVYFPFPAVRVVLPRECGVPARARGGGGGPVRVVLPLHVRLREARGASGDFIVLDQNSGRLLRCDLESDRKVPLLPPPPLKSSTSTDAGGQRCGHIRHQQGARRRNRARRLCRKEVQAEGTALRGRGVPLPSRGPCSLTWSADRAVEERPQDDVHRVRGAWCVVRGGGAAIIQLQEQPARAQLLLASTSARASTGSTGATGARAASSATTPCATGPETFCL